MYWPTLNDLMSSILNYWNWLPGVGAVGGYLVAQVAPVGSPNVGVWITALCCLTSLGKAYWDSSRCQSHNKELLGRILSMELRLSDSESKVTR